jgi:hypothetical protein
MTTLYAILCAVGIQSEVLTQSLIGGNYVKGPSGTVYVAGFGPYTAQNSATHTNITVAELTPELAAQLPALGKSVAISGIDNPEAFMAAFGLVRCDKDGNEFTGGEE